MSLAVLSAPPLRAQFDGGRRRKPRRRPTIAEARAAIGRHFRGIERAGKPHSVGSDPSVVAWWRLLSEHQRAEVAHASTEGQGLQFSGEDHAPDPLRYKPDGFEKYLSMYDSVYWAEEMYRLDRAGVEDDERVPGAWKACGTCLRLTSPTCFVQPGLCECCHTASLPPEVIANLPSSPAGWTNQRARIENKLVKFRRTHEADRCDVPKSKRGHPEIAYSSVAKFGESRDLPWKVSGFEEVSDDPERRKKYPYGRCWANTIRQRWPEKFAAVWKDLRPLQRNLFRWYFFDEQTLAEIAKRQRRRESRVSESLTRIRERFKKAGLPDPKHAAEGRVRQSLYSYSWAVEPVDSNGDDRELLRHACK